MVLDTNESYRQEQSGISALSKGADTQLMISMMERQSGPFDFDGTHEMLGKSQKFIVFLRELTHYRS